MIGAGDRALFWRDRWIHGARVAEIALLVLALVATQVANRRLVCAGLDRHNWTLDIRGELSTEALSQFIQLWEVLIPFVINPSVPDKAIWPWCASGCYSATSAYHMLTLGATSFLCAEAVWRCWAPLNCKLFMWLALQGRILTSDRRARHGLQEDPSDCILGDQVEESANHLLVQCVYARQVWFQCFIWMKIPPELIPTQHDRLEDCWSQTRAAIPKLYRRGFDSLVSLVCWSIWKHRNARVFSNGEIRNERSLSDRILSDIKVWAMAGARGLSQFCEE